MTSTRLSFAAVCLVATVVLGQGHALAQGVKAPVTVSGSYTNQSSVGRQGIGRITLTVSQFTGDSVRDQFLDTLSAKGDKALVDQMQKIQPVGRIRLDAGLGWDLRFARLLPGEGGGTRLVTATDRPIGFREAVNRPRVSDYPITVVEVTFDADGRPTGGRMAVAIKAEFDAAKNTLTLENYADRWISLGNLEIEK
jgi:hypothetical protein